MSLRVWTPFALILALAAALPFSAEESWAVIGAQAAIGWVLTSGLTLLFGFAARPAVGWAALAALGACAMVLLTGTGATGAGWPVYPALAASAALGAGGGLVLGLPARLLPRLWFALWTVGAAALVVGAIAALPALRAAAAAPPVQFPPPFDTRWGFYALAVGAAALCTWLGVNASRSRFGRALLAIGQDEPVARISGIGLPGVLSTAFLFAGATAGLAGGLLAGLRPLAPVGTSVADAALLSVSAVVIGGRGTVLGPLLATVLLVVLQAVAAPLGGLATLLSAGLLAALLFIAPEGLLARLDRSGRWPLAVPPLAARPPLIRELLHHGVSEAPLRLSGVALPGRARRAPGRVDLAIRPGQVHGLLGPPGAGKTAVLDVISGLARPRAGAVRLGIHPLPPGMPQVRARLGIARTFQAPHVIAGASVLDNVMIGAVVEGRASFAETLVGSPRHLRDERVSRDAALLALRGVGLESLAAERAGRLPVPERRLLEVARALVLRPAFLLLDEPAAGLPPEAAERLASLLAAIAAGGTGVLLAERDADLLFDVSHYVTVLDEGRVRAAGTPADLFGRSGAG